MDEPGKETTQLPEASHPLMSRSRCQEEASVLNTDSTSERMATPPAFQSSSCRSQDSCDNTIVPSTVYMCNFCSATFTTIDILSSHIENIHDKMKQLQSRNAANCTLFESEFPLSNSITEVEIKNDAESCTVRKNPANRMGLKQKSANHQAMNYAKLIKLSNGETSKFVFKPITLTQQEIESGVAQKELEPNIAVKRLNLSTNATNGKSMYCLVKEKTENTSLIKKPINTASASNDKNVPISSQLAEKKLKAIARIFEPCLKNTLDSKNIEGSFHFVNNVSNIKNSCPKRRQEKLDSEEGREGKNGQVDTETMLDNFEDNWNVIGCKRNNIISNCYHRAENGNYQKFTYLFMNDTTVDKKKEEKQEKVGIINSLNSLKTRSIKTDELVSAHVKKSHAIATSTTTNPKTSSRRKISPYVDIPVEVVCPATSTENSNSTFASPEEEYSRQDLNTPVKSILRKNQSTSNPDVITNIACDFGDGLQMCEVQNIERTLHSTVCLDKVEENYNYFGNIDLTTFTINDAQEDQSISNVEVENEEVQGIPNPVEDGIERNTLKNEDRETVNHEGLLQAENSHDENRQIHEPNIPSQEIITKQEALQTLHIGEKNRRKSQKNDSPRIKFFICLYCEKYMDEKKRRIHSLSCNKNSFKLIGKEGVNYRQIILHNDMKQYKCNHCESNYFYRRTCFDHLKTCSNRWSKPNTCDVSDDSDDSGPFKGFEVVAFSGNDEKAPNASCGKKFIKTPNKSRRKLITNRKQKKHYIVLQDDSNSKLYKCSYCDGDETSISMIHRHLQNCSSAPLSVWKTFRQFKKSPFQKKISDQNKTACSTEATNKNRIESKINNNNHKPGPNSTKDRVMKTINNIDEEEEGENEHQGSHQEIRILEGCTPNSQQKVESEASETSGSKNIESQKKKNKLRSKTTTCQRPKKLRVMKIVDTSDESTASDEDENKNVSDNRRILRSCISKSLKKIELEVLETSDSKNIQPQMKNNKLVQNESSASSEEENSENDHQVSGNAKIPRSSISDSQEKVESEVRETNVSENIQPQLFSPFAALNLHCNLVKGENYRSVKRMYCGKKVVAPASSGLKRLVINDLLKTPFIGLESFLKPNKQCESGGLDGCSDYKTDWIVSQEENQGAVGKNCCLRFEIKTPSSNNSTLNMEGELNNVELLQAETDLLASSSKSTLNMEEELNNAESLQAETDLLASSSKSTLNMEEELNNVELLQGETDLLASSSKSTLNMEEELNNVELLQGETDLLASSSKSTLNMEEELNNAESLQAETDLLASSSKSTLNMEEELNNVELLQGETDLLASSSKSTLSMEEELNNVEPLQAETDLLASSSKSTLNMEGELNNVELLQAETDLLASSSKSTLNMEEELNNAESLQAETDLLASSSKSTLNMEEELNNVELLQGETDLLASSSNSTLNMEEELNNAEPLQAETDLLASSSKSTLSMEEELNNVEPLQAETDLLASSSNSTLNMEEELNNVEPLQAETDLLASSSSSNHGDSYQENNLANAVINASTNNSSSSNSRIHSTLISGNGQNDSRLELKDSTAKTDSVVNEKTNEMENEHGNVPSTPTTDSNEVNEIKQLYKCSYCVEALNFSRKSQLRTHIYETHRLEHLKSLKSLTEDSIEKSVLFLKESENSSACLDQNAGEISLEETVKEPLTELSNSSNDPKISKSSAETSLNEISINEMIYQAIEETFKTPDESTIPELNQSIESKYEETVEEPLTELSDVSGDPEKSSSTTTTINENSSNVGQESEEKTKTPKKRWYNKSPIREESTQKISQKAGKSKLSQASATKTCIKVGESRINKSAVCFICSEKFPDWDTFKAHFRACHMLQLSSTSELPLAPRDVELRNQETANSNPYSKKQKETGLKKVLLCNNVRREESTRPDEFNNEQQSLDQLTSRTCMRPLPTLQKNSGDVSFDPELETGAKIRCVRPKEALSVRHLQKETPTLNEPIAIIDLDEYESDSDTTDNPSSRGAGFNVENIKTEIDLGLKTVNIAIKTIDRIHKPIDLENGNKIDAGSDSCEVVTSNSNHPPLKATEVSESSIKECEKQSATISMSSDILVDEIEVNFPCKFCSMVFEKGLHLIAHLYNAHSSNNNYIGPSVIKTENCLEKNTKEERQQNVDVHSASELAKKNTDYFNVGDAIEVIKIEDSHIEIRQEIADGSSQSVPQIDNFFEQVYDVSNKNTPLPKKRRKVETSKEELVITVDGQVSVIPTENPKKLSNPQKVCEFCKKKFNEKAKFEYHKCTSMNIDRLLTNISSFPCTNSVAAQKINELISTIQENGPSVSSTPKKIVGNCSVETSAAEDDCQVPNAQTSVRHCYISLVDVTHPQPTHEVGAVAFSENLSSNLQENPVNVNHNLVWTDSRTQFIIPSFNTANDPAETYLSTMASVQFDKCQIYRLKLLEFNKIQVTTAINLALARLLANWFTQHFATVEKSYVHPWPEMIYCGTTLSNNSGVIPMVIINRKKKVEFENEKAKEMRPKGLFMCKLCTLDTFECEADFWKHCLTEHKFNHDFIIFNPHNELLIPKFSKDILFKCKKCHRMLEMDMMGLNHNCKKTDHNVTAMKTTGKLLIPWNASESHVVCGGAVADNFTLTKASAIPAAESMDKSNPLAAILVKGDHSYANDLLKLKRARSKAEKERLLAEKMKSSLAALDYENAKCLCTICGAKFDGLSNLTQHKCQLHRDVVQPVEQQLSRNNRLSIIKLSNNSHKSNKLDAKLIKIATEKSQQSVPNEKEIQMDVTKYPQILLKRIDESPEYKEVKTSLVTKLDAASAGQPPHHSETNSDGQNSPSTSDSAGS